MVTGEFKAGGHGCLNSEFSWVWGLGRYDMLDAEEGKSTILLAKERSTEKVGRTDQESSNLFPRVEQEMDDSDAGFRACAYACVLTQEKGVFGSQPHKE
uniref:Uncharacterized protein n=1 Tax=Oryza minuta TaxID=63629 RepID=A0A1V1H7R2_ORYMI|nr:hypothetical protein [Oryza minuta]